MRPDDVLVKIRNVHKVTTGARSRSTSCGE